jgi:hypothetical protein
MPITVSDDFMAWKYVVKELDYCPRKTMLTEKGNWRASTAVSMGRRGWQETADAVERLGQGKKRAYAP